MPSVNSALDEALPLARQAVSAGAQFLFLPEYCGGLASEGAALVPPAHEENDHPFLASFQGFARDHSVWIMIGSIAVKGNAGKIINRGFVLDPEGRIISRYDKIHMFDVAVDDNQGAYRESALFEPGEDIVTCDCPLGTVGLSVCYDIRFPELYRSLFAEKVDLITVPSAFTETTGQAHFELLMRARAVENSCYMVAACQGGVHDSGRRTWGHSMVVDPWGRVVAELATGPGVLVCELDLQIRDQLRRDMPFHLQQRLTS